MGFVCRCHACLSLSPEGTAAYNQWWIITSDGKGHLYPGNVTKLKSSLALNKRELKFGAKKLRSAGSCSWRWLLDAHLEAILKTFLKKQHLLFLWYKKSAEIHLLQNSSYIPAFYEEYIWTWKTFEVAFNFKLR